MSHVSKVKVPARISLQIKRNLMSASIADKGTIIESLLTATEILMLSKRLAIIVMLLRGDSTYRISKLLKVSVSSVGRYQRMIEAGLFKPIARSIRKRNRSVLDILELVLSAGLPGAGPQHARRIKMLRNK